jgi:hypothetical protein
MSRKSLLRAVVAILICAHSSPGLSASRLSGAGAASCQVLATAAASRTPAGHAAVQWALGYLTGRIESGSNTEHKAFHGPDGIARDLIVYCRRHRDSQVADAATSFFTGVAEP